MADQLGDWRFEDRDMSGSNDRGSTRDTWRPGVGDEGVGEDQCDITERTILSSPDPAVVERLEIGHVLTIELQTKDPVRLLAKSTDGATAGTITSKRMPEIVACIQAGHGYDAEVLSVDGGRVEVMVRRR